MKSQKLSPLWKITEKHLKMAFHSNCFQRKCQVLFLVKQKCLLIFKFSVLKVNEAMNIVIVYVNMEYAGVSHSLDIRCYVWFNTVFCLFVFSCVCLVSLFLSLSLPFSLSL